MKAYQYITGRSDSDKAYSFDAASVGLPFAPTWMREQKRNDMATLNRPIAELQTDGARRFVLIQSRTVNQRARRTPGETAYTWETVRTYTYSHYLLLDAREEPLPDDILCPAVTRLLCGDAFADIPAYQEISEGHTGDALPVLSIPLEEASAQLAPRIEQAASDLPALPPDSRALAACLAKIWEAFWKRSRGLAFEPVYLTITPPGAVGNLPAQGVAFYLRYFDRFLPEAIRTQASVTFGTHFNAQDNQVGSACFILANEGIGAEHKARIFDFSTSPGRAAAVYDEDILLGTALLRGELPPFLAHFQAHAPSPALQVDYDIASRLIWLAATLPDGGRPPAPMQLQTAEQSYDHLLDTLCGTYRLAPGAARLLLLPVEKALLGAARAGSSCLQTQALRWLRLYEALSDIRADLGAEAADELARLYVGVARALPVSDRDERLPEALSRFRFARVEPFEAALLEADAAPRTPGRREWLLLWKRAAQAQDGGYAVLAGQYAAFLKARVTDEDALHSFFAAFDEAVLERNAMPHGQSEVVAFVLGRFTLLGARMTGAEENRLATWLTENPAAAQSVPLQQAGNDLLLAALRRDTLQPGHIRLMQALRLGSAALDQIVLAQYAEISIPALLSDDARLNALGTYVGARGLEHMDGPLRSYVDRLYTQEMDSAQSIVSLIHLHRHLNHSLLSLEDQVLTRLDLAAQQPLSQPVREALATLFMRADSEHRRQLAEKLILRFSVPSLSPSETMKAFMELSVPCGFSQMDCLRALEMFLAHAPRTGEALPIAPEMLDTLKRWVATASIPVAQAAMKLATAYEQFQRGRPVSEALRAQMLDIVSTPPFAQEWPHGFGGESWTALRLTEETTWQAGELSDILMAHAKDGRALDAMAALHRKSVAQRCLPASAARPEHEAAAAALRAQVEAVVRAQSDAALLDARTIRRAWDAFTPAAGTDGMLLSIYAREALRDWTLTHYTALFDAAKQDTAALHQLDEDLRPVLAGLDATHASEPALQAQLRSMQTVSCGLDIHRQLRDWQQAQRCGDAQTLSGTAVAWQLLDILGDLDERPVDFSDIRTLLASFLAEIPPSGLHTPVNWAAHLLRHLLNVRDGVIDIDWEGFFDDLHAGQTRWSHLDIWHNSTGLLELLYGLYGWFDTATGLRPVADSLLAFLHAQEGATRRARNPRQLRRIFRQLDWRGRSLQSSDADALDAVGSLGCWLFGIQRRKS